ncbi:uncharacterized protein LOC131667430 isoform X1 [Phymastichus coffea]|uniref:uncharacterized protein LOC131667430 isoform X1 n=1 Tax=Phymastichus coffea TaxID=108790 RepID=UPI00273C7D08|nr:uncharacterized protein LOC131667430 isoform X1 [Phymastichus coffea]
MESAAKGVEWSQEQACRSKLRLVRARRARRLDQAAQGEARGRQAGHSHGLELVASTTLHKAFADVCFCDATQEYLLLDRAVEVQRFSAQGKQLRPAYPLEPSMSFGRLLWCGAEAQCLVGYEPGQPLIWLLSPRCRGLRPALGGELRARTVHYAPGANQLVVVSAEQALTYRLGEERAEPSAAVAYADPDSGPSWQLDCSTLLAPDAAWPGGRLASSYLSTLYLLALPAEGLADEPEHGRPLARRAGAAPAAITALRLYEPAAWLLVGDQQGNLLAYNLELECVMAQEGAHGARLAMLHPHPTIRGFLSAARGELRVWSCDMRAGLEAFGELGGALVALAVAPAAASVLALAGRRLSFLTMHRLYCSFAPLTSPVKCLTSTQNPMYSTKTTVVSKDNSVRIFSSDGSQLSVQILPEEPLNVVSAAYCGNANRLFTIISEAGEILVSDSSACPMKFKSVFVSSEERITSIVGYEIYEEIRNDDGTSKRNRVFYPVGIRIIAGTDNGKLIVVNSLTGKHESMCWAHRGSVMQLRSSSISHRLVSLGTDKCVKVWHILPELAQPLHLFYDVHFTLRINQVATMGSILCVVNSSKTDNVHQLIMYHMKERERLEHPNTDDHRAPIVDMITSESLKICATSSLDNTIRIWSDDNCLVNVLRLNLCAWSTAFSSVNGDIVFGAGRRLYKIPYENYLTPYYQAKMSTTDLSEDDYDELVAEDSKYRIYDNEINRSAMLHPVNSLLLASIDVFDSKNPQVDLVQKQICELIESRDEDIRNIKNYLVTSSKVITSRALMTAQQWEEYVNDLLSSLTPTVPQLPEFQFKSIVETNSQENKAYNEPAVFHMLFGYSLDNLQYTECLAEKIMNDIFPLHGFLPNSILYKSKEPEIPKVYEKPPKKELVKYKYPVEFFKKSQESILEARKSIRLSQLVLVESKTDEQENA